MGLTDVWNDINFYEEKRLHPTQKPVKLIERIIRASSHENMIVLDPFMGSGSTAIACLNLNRYYIGIEKEDKYIEKINSRIAQDKSNQISREQKKQKTDNEYNQLSLELS